MNPDRIALKQILEGLVHNLNTPLNLILGYAQRLRQIEPEGVEAERIYKAGLVIDDTLKEIIQKLRSNSFDLPDTLNLGDWLSGELKYLQHILSIKHSLKFERQDVAELPAVLASPLSLSIWYESALNALLKHADTMRLFTGTCMYQGKAALYIMVPPELGALPELELLCEDSQHPQLLPSSRVQSVWDAASRYLYGVIP